MGAAVDVHGLPGDVACAVGGQEERGLGDAVGLPGSPVVGRRDQGGSPLIGEPVAEEAGSGPPYELTTREIARRTLITAGAVSQRVARAERAGLVARAPSSVSRRAVSVGLTETGHALIEDTVRQLLEHEAGLIDTLAGDERTVLTGILAKLEDALRG